MASEVAKASESGEADFGLLGLPDTGKLTNDIKPLRLRQDFDGNGVEDPVLRDTRNGQITIYFMSNRMDSGRGRGF